MMTIVPNTALRRDIPLLNREIALDQIREFERLCPGPYSIMGFEPYPAERYGLAPGTYFEYFANRYDPTAARTGGDPTRKVTHLYRHIEDVWEELKGEVTLGGVPVVRMKVWVADGQGRTVFVDSQVIEKARKLVISASVLS